MLRGFAKTTAVMVGSTILATLAVNAVDMRGDISNSLVAQVFTNGSPSGPCPEHMALVSQALVPFCVDRYEASTNEECIFEDPATPEETVLNLSNAECGAVSQPNALPWRHVTQFDAQQACSRAGKRLLTPGEWYKAALGTPDLQDSLTRETCNVSKNRMSGVAETGGGMRCVSDVGAYDMIGNVWEWVDGTVKNGLYEGEELPKTGYVAEADMNGMAYTTSPTKNTQFGNDRFWSDATVLAGIMRGGYYESNDQAGIFSTYAASPPTFSGDAVGFRCAVTPLGT